MLALYGNACQRCGESDPVVLEQHHTKGGGHTGGYSDYPPELRAGSGILVRATLRWFTDYGSVPPDIELLCANCHKRANATRRFEVDPPTSISSENLLAKKAALEHALREVNAQLVGIA